MRIHISNQQIGVTQEERSQFHNTLIAANVAGGVAGGTIGATHATYRGYSTLRGVGRFGFGGLFMATMYTCTVSVLMANFAACLLQAYLKT